MLPLIKPLSIALVFITATGVLLHDMSIDKATKVAFAAPAALAMTGVAAHAVVKMDHVHVERASAPKMANIFHSSLPKISPPRDDDRRYVQSKKHLALTGGDDRSYLWPSV
jgi:hypothetical protein